MPEAGSLAGIFLLTDTGMPVKNGTGLKTCLGMEAATFGLLWR